MARQTLFYILFFSLAAGIFAAAVSAENNAPPKENAAQNILRQLEARYGGKNFTADFLQESTLTAMDITDTATGKAWFKHPGKMRWEYITPEKHAIITDGSNLWIYRPADNQVIKGDAVNYFGNGKGASFLSNFSLVQESFDVSLDQQTDSDYRLKLIPREKQYELSAIYLVVDKESLDIEQVISENVYGDITRITFDNLTFSTEIDDARFHFDIPPGADVVEMDNE